MCGKRAFEYASTYASTCECTHVSRYSAVNHHANDPPSIGSFANDRTPNYETNLGHSRNTAFRLEYETWAKEPSAKNETALSSVSGRSFARITSRRRDFRGSCNFSMPKRKSYRSTIVYTRE